MIYFATFNHQVHELLAIFIEQVPKPYMGGNWDNLLRRETFWLYSVIRIYNLDTVIPRDVNTSFTYICFSEDQHPVGIEFQLLRLLSSLCTWGRPMYLLVYLFKCSFLYRPHLLLMLIFLYLHSVEYASAHFLWEVFISTCSLAWFILVCILLC